MEEIETVRQIEEPFEGSLEWRVHDLLARITESQPCDAEEVVLFASYKLLDFAVQHVEDLEELSSKMIDLWKDQLVQ